ncbi:MAG TPA: J domain-containing protein [Vicinamibacterales bacterium]|nr:J domain-containing protein [Vicinamibacterales bacterium]
MKNYYELLEITPAATADEVKRSFRAQIAKYHPDKVQHLGKEFQAMAADRAAELTEAYRILSDEGRRADYDRAFAAGGAPSAPAPPSPAAARATASAEPYVQPARRPPVPEGTGPAGAQFRQERATRDEFVRKATMGRLRVALASVGGTYDVADARGFDIALVPKKKLFSSNKNPRLLGRIVSTVDREAVADAWAHAAKWAGTDEACVLLMGTSLAPAGDLATEIGDQRKRHGKAGGGKLVLIPVDARDWEARMPLDAPPIAKTLLARLKSGT